jgi:hypothetical protein
MVGFLITTLYTLCDVSCLREHEAVRHKKTRHMGGFFIAGSIDLLVNSAGQLFHDLAALDFVDDLLVLGADGAAAGVVFGGVQTGLLDVPGCNFQVLIYVHDLSSSG